MNPTELNKSLVAIIEKKEMLAKLSYNDDRYDDIEEELHDLEDEFNEAFGPYLEEVLEDIHAKHCPDTDVLLPTAYLPNSLNGTVAAGQKEGIWVDSDEFPGKEARLVLVPNPTRIILSVGAKNQKELWKAE